MSLFFAQNPNEIDGLGYGYLYNWYAASDANFAPTDWKVPSISDVSTLKNFITNDGYSGNEGGALKTVGFNYFDSPNTGAIDAYGFSGIGSGRRDNGGGFENSRQLADFYYTDEYDSNNSYGFFLFYTSGIFYLSSIFPKTHGKSIRLLYTGAGTPTSVTDYDGNIYDVVQIGTQYFTVQNWKCTKLNNGTTIPNVTNDAAWAGLTTPGLCVYDNDINNL